MSEQQRLKIVFLIHHQGKLWIPVDLFLGDNNLFMEYHKEQAKWSAYDAGFQIEIDETLWNKTTCLGDFDQERGWLTALADVLRADMWGSAVTPLDEELQLFLQRTNTVLEIEEKSLSNQVICPTASVDVEHFVEEFIPEARKAAEFVSRSIGIPYPEHLAGPREWGDAKVLLPDWSSPLKSLEEAFDQFRRNKHQRT